MDQGMESSKGTLVSDILSYALDWEYQLTEIFNCIFIFFHAVCLGP